MRSTIVSLHGDALTSTSAPALASEELPLLLILLADTPVPPMVALRGDYHPVFCHLLQRSLCQWSETEPHEGVVDKQLEVRSFDAVGGEYPSESECQRAKGLLISGSGASAYDDVEWIKKMTEYTSQLPVKHPRLKLVGICFGQQIIAQALGAEVVRSDKGWEIGVRSLDLTDWGKAVFPDHQQLRIQQLHRDITPKPPQGYVNLASTPVCEVHGFLSLYPSSATPAAPPEGFQLSDVYCIALQGHPEYWPEAMLKVIEVREQAGRIPEDVAKESRVFAMEADEGVYFGVVLLKILGV